MHSKEGRHAGIRVSILYPSGPGKKFDMDYYLNRHIPMVSGILQPLGMVKAEADRGLGTAQPGAPAPFVAAAHLYFQTVEAFQQAFGPHAAEMTADIPNYTDIEPVIQISEIALG